MQKECASMNTCWISRRRYTFILWPPSEWQHELGLPRWRDLDSRGRSWMRPRKGQARVAVDGSQSGGVTELAVWISGGALPVLRKQPSENGALCVTLKAFSLAFDRGEDWNVFHLVAVGWFKVPRMVSRISHYLHAGFHSLALGSLKRKNSNVYEWGILTSCLT